MSKKNKFISEFREFVMRGNVIDLAVGVIIGGAFQSIVKSLVDDMLMPIISIFTGGIDFNNWFIVLGEGDFATAADSASAGVATLNYGAFISAVLNFLIMAFVIFVFVKGINKVTSKFKKEEVTEEPVATTKVCPYCKSEININATKCPHCISDLNDEG